MLHMQSCVDLFAWSCVAFRSQDAHAILLSRQGFVSNAMDSSRSQGAGLGRRERGGFDVRHRGEVI